MILQQGSRSPHQPQRCCYWMLRASWGRSEPSPPSPFSLRPSLLASRVSFARWKRDKHPDRVKHNDNILLAELFTLCRGIFSRLGVTHGRKKGGITQGCEHNNDTNARHPRKCTEFWHFSVSFLGHFLYQLSVVNKSCAGYDTFLFFTAYCPLELLEFYYVPTLWSQVRSFPSLSSLHFRPLPLFVSIFWRIIDSKVLSYKAPPFFQHEGSMCLLLYSISAFTIYSATSQERHSVPNGQFFAPNQQYLLYVSL